MSYRLVLKDENDLIISKEIMDPDLLKEGDIIYRRSWNNNLELHDKLAARGLYPAPMGRGMGNFYLIKYEDNNLGFNQILLP